MESEGLNLRLFSNKENLLNQLSTNEPWDKDPLKFIDPELFESSVQLLRVSSLWPAPLNWKLRCSAKEKSYAQSLFQIIDVF
jgi:hypothetical protein